MKIIFKRPSLEYIQAKIKEAKQKELQRQLNTIPKTGGIICPNSSEYYKSL